MWWRARARRPSARRRFHPSRPVRAGDPANLLLLARRARRSASISCPIRPRTGRWRRSGRGRKTHFHTLLGELLPGRLAEALAKKIGLWGELANLSDDKLKRGAAPARRLALPPKRQRRLRQGRGDRRRHQHRRSLLADDGSEAPCPASTRSARRSTSPAGWAAIISNGHGLVGGRPGRFFSRKPFAKPAAPPHLDLI